MNDNFNKRTSDYDISFLNKSGFKFGGYYNPDQINQIIDLSTHIFLYKFVINQVKLVRLPQSCDKAFENNSKDIKILIKNSPMMSLLYDLTDISIRSK